MADSVLIDAGTSYDAANPHVTRPALMRDYGGRLWAAFHDFSNKKTDIWHSDDNGVTWSLDAMDTAVGDATFSFDPSMLMVDSQNRLYLVRRGTSTPTTIQVWLRQASGWTNIESINASTVDGGTQPCDARIDYTNRSTAGFARIVAIYKRTANSSLFVSDNRFIPGNVDLDPLLTGGDSLSFGSIAIDSSGKVHIATVFEDVLDSTLNEVRYQTMSPSTPTVVSSPEVAADNSTGHPRATNVQLRLLSDGTPYIVFLADPTGSQDRAYYATRNQATGVWTIEEVWDGVTHTAHMIDHQAVSVDAFGTPFVLSVEGNNPNFWERRGLNDWIKTELQSSGVAVPEVGATMADANYVVGGTRPARVFRGVAGVYFYKPTAPSTNVYYFNSAGVEFDEGFEPPYDCPAEPNRTSVVIAGEGSSAGAMPDIKPNFTYLEGKEFITSEFRYEVGYVGTVSVMQRGRRLFSVRFEKINQTDRDTLFNFFEARKNSFEPFDFTVPDDDEVVKVTIKEDSVRYIKNNPGVYSVIVELEEQF